MMVVEALHSADKHISAEEIYAQVQARYPYANISTVYRTLDLLKELGLVVEISMGDDRVRFHPVDRGHHHHLVCRSCRKVVDIPETALTPLAEGLGREYGFKVELQHMAIFGLCAQCQRQAERRTED